MDEGKLAGYMESRTISEVYFLSISLLLAFGILQTTGEVLSTDKPVVSVTSCSMHPALDVGDILVVDGTSYESIEKGDIVVYNAEQTVISVGGQKRLMSNYNSSGSLSVEEVDLKLRNIGSVARDVNGDTKAEKVKFVSLEIDGEIYNIPSGASKTVQGVTVKVGKIGSNIPVVHRVTAKSKDKIETKGDNNKGKLWFEDSVTREQIYGELVFKIPRIGALKILAMDFLGFNGDKPFVIDAFPECRDRT